MSSGDVLLNGITQLLVTIYQVLAGDHEPGRTITWRPLQTRTHHMQGLLLCREM